MSEHGCIQIKLYLRKQEVEFGREFVNPGCSQSLSHVRLFGTPWTVAHQAPLTVEFSRQEHWNGLPFPTPGDLPNPGIEPTSPASPALAGGFFTTEPPGKPQNQDRAVIFLCKVHGHLLLFSHQLVSDSL